MPKTIWVLWDHDEFTGSFAIAFYSSKDNAETAYLNFLEKEPYKANRLAIQEEELDCEHLES